MNNVALRNFSPLVLLVLVPVWVGLLMWVLSHLSGWALLARRFRANGNFSGESWGWQSGRFRGWCGYNHCLSVGADPTSLHLVVQKPFGFFHPPLLIPWVEIEVTTGKAFLGFYDTALMRLGSEERVSFRIYGALVDRLRQAAGPAWPESTVVGK
jgi:hypothetical protein